ncbi:MAG: YciI family protein [Pseudomonadota bacterium]
MKYALLIHDDETFQRMAPAQQAEVIGAHQIYVDALTKAGVLIGGEPLGPSADALSVHPDGTVHDGPFADSLEQLGGFYLIEVASREDAIEWARRLPQCAPNGGAVEIRAVPDYAD